MPELFVMCPECGLRGNIAHSKQELDDVEAKCKHHVKPTKCPNLHDPLKSVRRVLDLFEWQTRRTQASAGDD